MRVQPSPPSGSRWDDFDRLSQAEKSSLLDEHIAHRDGVLSEYRQLVEHLRRRGGRTDNALDLYKRGISRLYVDDLTHLDLVQTARHERAPITHADSFWRNVVRRRRKKQLGPVPEKYLGISKEKDQLFGEILGIRMPKQHWTGRFGDIPTDLPENTLLKPLRSSGSKGAFYLFDRRNIFSIYSSRQLSGWSELADATEDQLGPDAKEETTWQIQELIFEAEGKPARDMKFYSFYGQVGLIQEVSRHPRKEYEFFNEDFTLAVCGREHEPRFEDSSDTVTDKGGLNAEKLDTVRSVSEAIPAPFMRIDFLNAEEELVFSEFSAAPGMSHTLNDVYDERLGRYYNEAEIRLINDLVQGKRFDAFTEFLDRHKAPSQPVEEEQSSFSRFLNRIASQMGRVG